MENRPEDNERLPKVSSAEILRQVRVVLVEPQISGNIGASARAMKNMGLEDLRLVLGADSVNADARKMAMYAKDVLYEARRHDSLPEAVADCALVMGATRRRGKMRQPTFTPRDAAPRILEVAQRYPVALVFGSENVGLSNEHLQSCHELVLIPAHSAFPSLNLAMAVLILCYEVFQALQAQPLPSPPPLASAQELEGLYGHIQSVLLEIGFLDPRNPARMMNYLRRLLGRANLNSRDVRVLRGLFRQVGWYQERFQGDLKGTSSSIAANALDDGDS